MAILSFIFITSSNQIPVTYYDSARFAGLSSSEIVSFGAIDFSWARWSIKEILLCMDSFISFSGMLTNQ